MPSDAARAFYDSLADDYHLIYPDWAASVARQGVTLDRVIRDALGAGAKDILDCSCGIGTQAIGLAEHAHRVVGADLSPLSAARAAQEAGGRGLGLAECLAAADMRRLPFKAESFDVVLSADNSVAHLLTDEDLHLALTSMRRVLRPGGALVITMRDYAAALAARQQATVTQITQTPLGRTVTLQLWRWRDGTDCYDFDHIQLLPDGDGWQVRTRTATSRALTRDRLDQHLREAGFPDPRWHEPESSGYFQPLVTARR